MGKVAELADYRSITQNRASMKCVSCGHEWEAVAPSPDPMVYFECPECGCDGGMKQGMVMIGDGEEMVWQCPCGSTVFEIYKDHGAFCINCGQLQNW